MKFKKILILLLITSFYNATETKSKNTPTQKHFSSQNSLENIKKIFEEYRSEERRVGKSVG